MSGHGRSPLPDNVMKSFQTHHQPAPRVEFREIEHSYVPSSGCITPVVAFLWMAALTVALVIYIIICNQKLHELKNGLETVGEAMMQTRSNAHEKTDPRSALLRSSVVLQRQEPPPATQPKLPENTKAPIAERPAWATELKPQWLQFETPLDESTIRLPPKGSHRGLSVAESMGYKIECNFGDSRIQSAHGQIEFSFHTNDETGDEYATLRVPGPAFRGRQCVLEWLMA